MGDRHADVDRDADASGNSVQPTIAVGSKSSIPQSWQRSEQGAWSEIVVMPAGKLS
jgi:hypothetical protein